MYQDYRKESVSARPRLTPAIADIRRAIREAWAEHGINPGDTVVIGCSGGADSLALTAAAIFEGKRNQITIVVGIVNHNLQKGSAKVAEEAKAKVVKLGANAVSVIHVEVPKSKNGMEAAAREIRYQALDALAKDHKAKVIMLGHTMDDQAETVLLGLARGSGSKSLAGMQKLSGDKKYLRPLLEIRRSQTEQFCIDSGLEFWNDPQNSQTKFTRVKVRNKVLPVLEKELGPGITEALSRTALILQEDSSYLDEKAEASFKKLAKLMATQIVLDAEDLAKEPKALANRVVLKALVLMGAEPTRGAIEAVMALATNWHGQKPLTLPGIRVIRQGKEITLKSTKTLKPGAC